MGIDALLFLLLGAAWLVFNVLAQRAGQRRRERLDRLEPLSPQSDGSAPLPHSPTVDDFGPGTEIFGRTPPVAPAPVAVAVPQPRPARPPREPLRSRVSRAYVPAVVDEVPARRRTPTAARARLRDAIVWMAVLGPCRAQQPHDTADRFRT